ncbi:hypothetical protein [Legionella sp.]|uniref:hypothetical protein n=1 Tax=Legionella sp. TaxID=459 RepID=UPI003C9C005F
MNKSTVPLSRFPSTNEIKSAMEMAGSTIEGAEYLAFRVKDLADNAKFLNKSPELKKNIISAIEKFVEYDKFKLTVTNQPWSGQYVEASSLINMQKNMAASAAKELVGKLTEVKLDYALSENGHYVRGYSSNNEVLDSDSVASLDMLFNAWLASKDYIIKGGYLYNVNDTTQNENTRINANVVKNLMAEGGLQEFMAEKGIHAVMNPREYPEEQKEAQAQYDVDAAIKEVTQVSAKQATEVASEETPKPTTPSS